ncbi:MAG: acyl-CoA dehydrogenase [Alphaproteobacteria bacterium]|nr:acyl-CoA dehydrogenase [Alphaproteobacteria bacterium]
MADTSFLDWPFLEPRHRDFATRLRAWSATTLAPLAADEPHGIAATDALARRLVAVLGEAGWLRAAVPAAHGGLYERLDVRTLCLARESLAYVSGLADFAFVMQGLGTGSITLYGTDAQRARYLPPVARGAAIAAFALTEPPSGSDVAAIETTARVDGDAYVLDGRKTFISNGGIADHYVVFARTGEAPGAKGLSAFIVDATSAGLHIAERIEVVAPHPLATLRFDACRIPRTALIGAPGEGFKVAMGTLDTFRPTVGAAALGFARRALDEAIRRARARHAFGRPIADYQLIQEKIADMAVEIDAAALLVYRAAWTKDVHDRRVTREAAIAKLFATEAAQRAADQVVQIFGGAGVVAGSVPERLYREVRALRIYEGTSEIQKLVIAGQTFAAEAP